MPNICQRGAAVQIQHRITISFISTFFLGFVSIIAAFVLSLLQREGVVPFLLVAAFLVVVGSVTALLPAPADGERVGSPHAGRCITCLVHATLPFLFVHAGSECISDLQARLSARRQTALPQQRDAPLS